MTLKTANRRQLSTFAGGLLLLDPGKIWPPCTPRLEGEGFHLVSTHALSRPASAFPAARSLDYIEDLALSTVRDQVTVLAAELGIALDDHDIALEGCLPLLPLQLSLPSAPCVTAAE